MKKLYPLLFISVLIYWGCEDEQDTTPPTLGDYDVPLWGVYYSVLNTTNLDLRYNELTGVIPPEIGNLTNLTILNLSGNQLTGEIPSEIGNLTNLTYLYLHDNQLTGSTPPEIGNLTNLAYLFLRSNQLTGSIPSEIGNLTNLSSLTLDNNELTGEIPSEIGNLTNLTSLELSHNELTGSIPPEISNLTNLERLGLFSNQLTDSIPSEIWNLTKLRYLLLDNNQLTGSIPPEIGNLTNLERLWLCNNQLTGEIPESICDLNVNWKNSNDFTIYNNQLCPPYPPCIENYVGQQKEVGVYIYFDSRQTWNALVDNGYGGGNKGDVFVNEDEFQGYINIGSFQDLVDVVLVLNETLYYEPVHINSCLELGFDSGEFEESIAEVFGPETAEKWINDIYDHIKSRADLDK